MIKVFVGVYNAFPLLRGEGGGLHFLVTTPFYFFLNIKIRNVLDYLLDFKLSNLYPVQKELFYC